MHMVFKYVKGPLVLHIYQLSFKHELTCNNNNNNNNNNSNMGPRVTAIV